MELTTANPSLSFDGASVWLETCCASFETALRASSG
jgi:hypothetical protein